ncbi:hypothetical protein OAA50_03500 [Candidatus Pelagibacter sp.]|nr:hypothetical protein [Candidatus Pelagibacter sp.]
MYISIILYFLLNSAFYFLTSSKPITFIFNNVFNGDISFLVNKKIETIERYINLFDEKFFNLVMIFPLILLIIFSIINLKKLLLTSNFKIFNNEKDETEHLDKYNLNYLIALAAGLGLYLELMIIRLHSSFFQLFSFFKNISLLSCLLGLGIGYLFGNKKLYSFKWVFPLLTVQIAFMFLLKNTPIGPLLQNPITEQWAMGLPRAEGVLQFFIIYSFVIIIFLSNAIIFVPLGHLVSRLMQKQEKLKSYSWNLLGSLSGIILFGLMSFIWSPPSLWILVGFCIYIIFIRKNFWDIVIPSTSILFLLLILLVPNKLNKQDIYSPYQIISLEHSNNPSKTPVQVLVGNTWFQTPYDLSGKTIYSPAPLAANYSAPYNITSKVPERVLIVGSGTGNDTAYAIQMGVKKIDAVEIDPVIIQIGKDYHPQKPYQSNKVNIIQNDARNFIQHTKNKYDLIVYGLLDSHASLSGRGGIRLDSYVYTVESFKEARKILSDNGYISLSFYLSEKELGSKIYLMLKEAFDGREPLVIPQNDIILDKFRSQPYAFLIGGEIDKNFDIKNSNLSKVNFFEEKDTLTEVDKSTDDWPFFYMPKKIFPKSYLFIIFLIFVSSFIFIQRVSPISKKTFSPVCFFLGAGFMLVETKGITELALVYGSTWLVVSIVIGFVLIMAFLANLLIINKVPIKVWLIYSLILSSVLLGYSFTLLDHSGLSSLAQKIIVPAILTIPIFFSGLAFSKQLSIENSVSIALSSNILGAIFGGLLEYNSMYFGFRSLYIFGFFMYLFAYLFVKKSYKIV